MERDWRGQLRLSPISVDVSPGGRDRAIRGRRSRRCKDWVLIGMLFTSDFRRRASPAVVLLVACAGMNAGGDVAAIRVHKLAGRNKASR